MLLNITAASSFFSLIPRLGVSGLWVALWNCVIKHRIMIPFRLMIGVGNTYIMSWIWRHAGCDIADNIVTALLLRHTLSPSLCS